ncbi:MAG: lipoyl synthase [Armatimonadetes bacterium]|nr:lipoyl synthase [Armatimonadota bacterium]
MTYLRKPKWLTSKKIGASKAQEIKRLLREYNLHTVCESARCPNLGECFENGTATFMILGNICTRNCTFCAVEKSSENLLPPDSEEPCSIAELSKKLGLKHVVITTVTRDDLPDGGASQFIKVIKIIKEICEKNISIEVLISDFNGDLKQVIKVVDAAPDILNHNVETIPRLYPIVRPKANFVRSISVLQTASKSNRNILTKSGFMIGLGETEQEVLTLLEELRKADVDIVTIGQYMQPSKDHYPVKEFIHPEVFDFYKDEGEKMGFKIVESAPLVRSSYHAERARKIMRNHSQI